jgi:hypothetical protein
MKMKKMKKMMISIELIKMLLLELRKLNSIRVKGSQTIAVKIISVIATSKYKREEPIVYLKL